MYKLLLMLAASLITTSALAEDIVGFQVQVPTIDYTGIVGFQAPEVKLSDPTSFESSSLEFVLRDPSYYLLVIALGMFVLIARSYFKQSSHPPFIFALFTGIAVALLVASLSWPEFFGHPIPIDELARFNSSDFKLMVQPMLTKAAISGGFAFLVIWGLLIQKKDDKKSSTDDNKIKRGY